VAAWLPGDDRLFVSGGDRRVKVWDATMLNNCVLPVKLLASVRGGAVTEGPPIVAVALGDNTLRLVDLRTGGAVSTLQGHTRPPLTVAWGKPGECRLFSGGMDGTLRAWDTRMGARSLYACDAYGDEEPRPLKRLESNVERAAATGPRNRNAGEEPDYFNPTSRTGPYGMRSLSSVLQSNGHIRNAPRNRICGAPVLSASGTGMTGAELAAKEDTTALRLGDGAHLREKFAAAAKFRARHFVDPPRREYEHETSCAHRDAVIGLAFPHGARRFSRLLSCGIDGKIRAWDASTGKPLPAAWGVEAGKPLRALSVECWCQERGLQIDAEGAPEDVCLVPEHDNLAVYCLRSGSLLYHLSAHTGAMTAAQRVMAGPGARRREVVTGGEDGRLLIWRVAPGADPDRDCDGGGADVVLLD